MAERKQRALERIGSLDENHRLVEVDALRDSGPQSLAAVAETLDRSGGLAIVTEGPGSYMLTLSPTDLSGNHGRRASIGFRVVKK